MKKFGFTLIELIISMAISSMMIIILFTSFFQVNKTVQSVDTMISIDSRAVVLQNQFEMDISGAFVPDITEIKEKKTEPLTKTTKEKAAAEKEIAEKKEQEQKPKKLEKAFYSINQNKILKELTFITCNPLQIYGQTKPRMARVTYRLKEDKQIKGSYSLFRQESAQIIYGAEKNVIEYEVVNNIKELLISYFIIPDEKGKEAKPVNEWKSDESKKQEKETTPKIPQYVTVKVNFWDNDRHLKDQLFEFKYMIYSFIAPKPKPEQKIPEKVSPDKTADNIKVVMNVKKV